MAAEADLVSFITARLDEDEAAAKAAASVAGPGWKAETYWPEDGGVTRTCIRSEAGAFLADLHDTPDYPDLAAHIARHDPARVLREVGAKRRILAEVKDLIDRMDAQIEQEWGTGLGPSGESDLLLKLLALPYSDHPDYRLEWAP